MVTLVFRTLDYRFCCLITSGDPCRGRWDQLHHSEITATISEAKCRLIGNRERADELSEQGREESVVSSLFFMGGEVDHADVAKL